jgi:orotidine-5'-phosphate decarboxylase
MDPETARGRLALALDLDDLDAARALAEKLVEHIGIVKIGLELYAAAGPQAVELLQSDGFAVFLDLKLHDIPTTVGRAARRLGQLAPAYATTHTQGGAAMLRAFAEGLAAGAADVGAPPPVALGVTVLTSDADASPDELARRAELAASSGLGGVVCAAPDLAVVRRVAPGLVTMVPGTRPPGVARDDQERVSTPAEAFAAGADVLVVGRAVTAAEDPLAAAIAFIDGLATPLG